LNADPHPRTWQSGIDTPEFYDCVMGIHPSIKECLENIPNPEYGHINTVAFDRNFALVRGPMDLLFAAYKTDVVGYLPDPKKPEIMLGKKFRHLREVAEETKQFTDIKVQS
jgi:hypothetical protein